MYQENEITLWRESFPAHRHSSGCISLLRDRKNKRACDTQPSSGLCSPPLATDAGSTQASGQTRPPRPLALGLWAAPVGCTCGQPAALRSVEKMRVVELYRHTQ